MLGHKSKVQLFILVTFLIILIIYKKKINRKVSLPQLIDVRENAAENNNHYIINNNIVQYSSYLVSVDEMQKLFRIEAFYMLSERIFGEKLNKPKPLLSDYSCIVKVLPSEEIIELEAERQISLKYYLTHKIIFCLI